MADQPYVYDKSKYHMESTSGSWELASGPALFILRWLIDRDLISDFFREDSEPDLTAYRSGKMTLFELYERRWDLCLIDDMVSGEGNAFGQIYFDYEKGAYLSDLDSLLHHGREYPHFSEGAYSRVKAVIDERYTAWQRGESVQKPPPQSPVKKYIGISIFVVLLLWVLFWFLSTN